MIQGISRVIKTGLLPGTRHFRKPRLRDLTAMQEAMKSCIADCEGMQALKLRHRIEKTQTAQELWMLRNDAFQLVSHLHSQAEAASRINGLIEIFKGWVAPRHLTRIG